MWGFLNPEHTLYWLIKNVLQDNIHFLPHKNQVDTQNSAQYEITFSVKKKW